MASTRVQHITVYRIKAVQGSLSTGLQDHSAPANLPDWHLTSNGARATSKLNILLVTLSVRLKRT